ncbi:hypothetical protein I545_6925 [Mycobacterium kansasii 662]|uniref:Uncharacterized protein n=1 Tax=Mycobacterium kansasii 662 TaxID=1299326 RepID=X7XQQ2_MYCKA|nr:hypothetical protein I545_6925 [Mycobacterium kansasii 662]
MMSGRRRLRRRLRNRSLRRTHPLPGVAGTIFGRKVFRCPHHAAHKKMPAASSEAASTEHRGRFLRRHRASV